MQHAPVQEADPIIVDLLDRCRRDHASWINGDGSPYALPSDGTILGAVGGFSLGGAETAGRQEAVAAQWASGTGSVEFVNGGVSGDVAWLVLIERARVRLVSHPEIERQWDLRVTEVFERREAGWQRLHRHADPLVSRRSLNAVLDIAAGT